MNNSQFERRTISICISVDLLAQIDEYAKKACLNRSAAINTLVLQSLNQENAIDVLARILDKYDSKHIQDTDK